MGTQNNTIKIFDPSSLSEEQTARLEELLNQIDLAANERAAFIAKAYFLAYQEWAEAPEENTAAGHDYYEIFNAIEDDRWASYMKMCTDNLLNFGEAETAPEIKGYVASLLSLSPEKQKEAQAFSVTEYTKYVDALEDRKLWGSINNLYKTVLNEFPEILISGDDFLGAMRLNLALQEKNTDLKTSAANPFEKSDLGYKFNWFASSIQGRLNLCKKVLGNAYPEDNVADVNAHVVSLKSAGAAYLMGADTIVCGDKYLENNTQAIAAYFLSHEMQHRRQFQLIEKLTKGELKKGSAEHFQARLFKSNFTAYLSPQTAKSKITKFARVDDYNSQPVEAQANLLASLANKGVNDSGVMVWSLNEKLCSAFSAVSKPIDHTVCAISTGASKVTSLFKKSPNTP